MHILKAKEICKHSKVDMQVWQVSVYTPYQKKCGKLPLVPIKLDSNNSVLHQLQGKYILPIKENWP